VRNFIDAGLADKPEWPRLLLTTSNGSLAPLVAQFKGRAVGFTQVVPNPDIPSLPLARDLEQHTYVSRVDPRAVTFQGMEGHISARLLVEALRKSGPKPTAARLAEALSAQSWNINGFRVEFGSGRSSGSDWVEIGLRSRKGLLVN
jgi:hypothetical protein